jgi:hypothetical protein
MFITNTVKNFVPLPNLERGTGGTKMLNPNEFQMKL